MKKRSFQCSLERNAIGEKKKKKKGQRHIDAQFQCNL